MLEISILAVERASRDMQTAFFRLSFRLSPRAAYKKGRRNRLRQVSPNRLMLSKSPEISTAQPCMEPSRTHLVAGCGAPEEPPTPANMRE